MPTIFVKDDLRASVEAASGGQMTVLYTDSGQPSYMNIIPKFKLEDISPTLGTGVHPAFVVGGIEKSELFVGTYQGIDKNGELLSLPGVDPTVSRNHDSFVSLARANGPGWHCITFAEWAALALWCWKNGHMPRGNSNYGRSSDATWETARRIDGGMPGDTSTGGRTLTGSGPATWRHDNTSGGISDLNGNIWEWTPGMRLVDGEIQIIPNNDAALNATDLGVSSGAWRAIRASDGELVAPGTAGTLKYDATGPVTGAPVLSDTMQNMQGDPGDNTNDDGNSAINLQSLTARSGLTAPGIARALGLFPVGEDLGDDRLYVRNYGERLPLRGGAWSSGSDAGVFALGLRSPRTGSNADIGSRPAFVL